MVNDSLKTLSRKNGILSCSNIVGIFFFIIAVEFHYKLAREYINANDVMPIIFILQIKRGGISVS